MVAPTPSPRPALILLVALHKSGTHLVHRLVEGLGYRVRYFTDQQRRYASSAAPAEFWAGFEPGSALVVHDLPYHQFPPNLRDHWLSTDQPRLLFHWRDPRATLLSLVNYLCGEHRSGEPTWTEENAAHAAILLAVTKEPQRLSLGIEHLTARLRRSYMESAWLLDQAPTVVTTYEQLVGSRGGGRDPLQREVVRSVRDRMGSSASIDALTRTLFDPDQRTFFKGMATRWQQVYTADQLRSFQHCCQDVLERYGDPWQRRRSISNSPVVDSRA